MLLDDDFGSIVKADPPRPPYLRQSAQVDGLYPGDSCADRRSRGTAAPVWLAADLLAPLHIAFLEMRHRPGVLDRVRGRGRPRPTSMRRPPRVPTSRSCCLSRIALGLTARGAGARAGRRTVRRSRCAKVCPTPMPARSLSPHWWRPISGWFWSTGRGMPRSSARFANATRRSGGYWEPPRQSSPRFSRSYPPATCSASGRCMPTMLRSRSSPAYPPSVYSIG